MVTLIEKREKSVDNSGAFSGVPRDSVSELLLFNVFICDIFYLLEDFDIVNHADDSTPYNADKNIEFLLNNLEQSSSILFKWLNDHYMKVNTGKSHPSIWKCKSYDYD